MLYKRVDGIRIRKLDSFHVINPYIMPKRTEAEVSSRETFDVTDLMDYIKSRNAADGSNLKMFHAFCTALARTIYLRPKMNIFIAGKHFWQRNDILLSFVAKQRFEDTAEEKLMCLKIDPDMNLDAISHKILGDVRTVREPNGSNHVGDTLDFVAKLPRCVLLLLFGVLRIFEFFGIFPYSLMKGDPNYSTALLSNLGSIGAGAPYHHLSNYGTCSIMITIGTITPTAVLQQDGSVQTRQMLDITFTIDERIADGFYYAKSLRITKFLMEHPQYLEQSINQPVPVEV